MSETIYLAGPMAGYPEWNHPAFHATAGRLRSAGYVVLNPADYGTDETDWATCLRRDLLDVLRAEAMVVLPGWQQSHGATLEVDVAQRLGMPVHRLSDLLGEAASSTEQLGSSPALRGDLEHRGKPTTTMWTKRNSSSGRFNRDRGDGA